VAFQQSQCGLLDDLQLPPFRQRFPWWNGDLQTLRDSVRPVQLSVDRGQPVPIAVGGGDRLLAYLDAPLSQQPPLACVLLIHGLGGSSSRPGLRRMALCLQQAGFAVLRLNLRGAGSGRALASGTYAAQCNRDLLPVLRRARQLAMGKPLLAIGFSLGGSQLLNVVLASAQERQLAGLDEDEPLLDGLLTISSPLDLEACSQQIARPRNRIYQHWLLKRLVAQTLADPFGVSALERQWLEAQSNSRALASIRSFDAAITAPRWGYSSVEHYYSAASPLTLLRQCWQDVHKGAALPPLLVVHALDDPWVPARAAQQLAQTDRPAGCDVLLTAKGGHNGFHGNQGCWSDALGVRWCLKRINT
jgi:predicted alpha/beta-fold hydrolase